MIAWGYMATPLDYQPRRPKHPLAAWLTIIMLIAGSGMLILGGALAIFTWIELRESQTNPNWTWGPGAYVYSMLQSFACFAFLFLPVGAALLLMGSRRLRRKGADKALGAELPADQGAGR